MWKIYGWGGKDDETYLESYASTEKTGRIVWLLYELQNNEKRLKNTGRHL